MCYKNFGESVPASNDNICKASSEPERLRQVSIGMSSLSNAICSLEVQFVSLKERLSGLLPPQVLDSPNCDNTGQSLVSHAFELSMMTKQIEDIAGAVQWVNNNIEF